MSVFVPAKTIDEVIQRMDTIVQECISKGSRLGYFAALYRDVTIEVKKKIGERYFNDNERMEKFDVVFANRYLEALHGYLNGSSISVCWKKAFHTAQTGNTSILQHLLLGMNAHINFDLGIAASEVAGRQITSSFKADFEKIMLILSSMIDNVQERIEKVSPAFSWIDTLGGRNDEMVSGFMISKARDMAWLMACYLKENEDRDNRTHLMTHDKRIMVVAEKIIYPGKILSLGMKFIRWREVKDPAKVIKTLMTTPINLNSGPN